MKNQNGFGIVMMIFGVFVMVVSFIGTASIYFNTLYQEIGRQQRSVAAHLAMQDFAVMAHRAHEIYRAHGAACTVTTETDGAYELCWPRALNFQHCVPHPLGNTGTTPRWICRTPAGGATGVVGGDGIMDVVLQTQVKPVGFFASLWDQGQRLKQMAEIGIDVVAADLQNLAFAQNEAMHLPSIAGASSLNFSSPIDCSTYDPANDAYCKRCPGMSNANLVQCFRIRICLRPVPCNAANNDEWVVQTIAILDR